MDEREGQIHRTWVQLIIDNGFKDVAAIAIDSEITIIGYDYQDFGEFHHIDSGIMIDIPSEIYTYVKTMSALKK